MKHPAIAAALLGAAWILAGCVPDSPPPPPPPAPVVETMPLPPVSASPLIWQPGHWDWNGSGYVWARGQYVPARGHGNLWVPGWWSRSDAGWVWQPAHWTS